MPEGTERIAPGAFRGSRVERVDVPGTVKTVAADAFRDCRNLRRAVLAEGVEELGEAAFAGCGAFGEECVAVWEEYEAQETPESRWVKQLDRLEMGIQGVVYEHSQAPIDLGDFMASTDDALHDADLREFWNSVKALRPAK